MTVRDIINEIFESQEMRDYLCEQAEELYKYQIKEMIAGSPTVTVQRKLEMFEWLAEGEDLEKELLEAKDESERKHILWCSYAEIVKNTREALNALYDTNKPAVFLVKCIICWSDDIDEFEVEETIPFISYENAVQYIREQEDVYGKNNRRWFQIEKWEQDEKGRFYENWSYVAVKGRICFCSKCGLHRNECSQDKDVNLPVPFRAGDIIEVQDMPIARIRHVLILDTGDNRDCCSVWQAYIDKDGRVCTNALKHGDIFDSWYATSPLYSAKTFYGVLEGEEEVLYTIQRFMNKFLESEDRWYQLFEVFNYVSENQIHSREITEEVLDGIYDRLSINRSFE